MQITMEQQLICECCEQPYYPHEEWQDQLMRFGKATSRTKKYAICPICTQEVPEQTSNNFSYRSRWQKYARRLQRQYDAHVGKIRGKG
jgi:rRNA maturation protein Nop10